MSGLDDRVVALFDGRRIGSLGTRNQDGTVHLTAIWYVLKEDRILIPTSSKSRKARNVHENGIATVMVDIRTDEGMTGAVIQGEASLISGSDALALNGEIHQRYLTDEALSDEVIGPLFRDGDNVTVAVRCDSVVTWDMEALFSFDGYLRPLD